MNAFAITPNLILAGMFAGGAAAGAAGVVAFRNALRSAMCLVVNFIMLGALYFTLEAEMLGITQIVVYTGAIMVLFLFVIMLLNLGSSSNLDETKDPKVALGLLGALVVFALLAVLVLKRVMNITDPGPSTQFGRPDNLGGEIFTLYTWPFEAASFLLLVGIVGSILLAKRRIQ